jgi:hypothetical protein
VAMAYASAYCQPIVLFAMVERFECCVKLKLK